MPSNEESLERTFKKADGEENQYEDLEAFLKREIAKPIICWQDSPLLGDEISPNEYPYRCQPSALVKELHAEFWRLGKLAVKMLEGLPK